MVEPVSSLERWGGGAPGRHELSTLQGLERSPADEPGDVFFRAVAKLVDRWQGNDFVGLYLYGTPGNGKTHAAIGLSRALHKAGAEVHYRYVPALPDYCSDVSYWIGERHASPKDATIDVFPARFSQEKYPRNPRTVLLLDDYKPEKQPHTVAAIEAAAQFGGAVILTSNHPDPFQLVEGAVPPASDTDLVNIAFLKQLDPDVHDAAEAARQQRTEQISASLRSRLRQIKFIPFTGPDRRLNFFDD